MKRSDVIKIGDIITPRWSHSDKFLVTENFKLDRPFIISRSLTNGVVGNRERYFFTSEVDFCKDYIRDLKINKILGDSLNENEK